MKTEKTNTSYDDIELIHEVLNIAERMLQQPDYDRSIAALSRLEERLRHHGQI